MPGTGTRRAGAIESAECAELRHWREGWTGLEDKAERTGRKEDRRGEERAAIREGGRDAAERWEEGRGTQRDLGRRMVGTMSWI